MPKRIAVNTVHVQRDNKIVAVAPGTLFDFSAEELADIKRLSPRAVRVPVAEDGAEFTEEQLQKAAKDQAAAEALATKEAKDRAEKAAAEAAKNKTKGTASAAGL